MKRQSLYVLLILLAGIGILRGELPLWNDEIEKETVDDWIEWNQEEDEEPLSDPRASFPIRYDDSNKEFNQALEELHKSKISVHPNYDFTTTLSWNDKENRPDMAIFFSQLYIGVSIGDEVTQRDIDNINMLKPQEVGVGKMSQKGLAALPLLTSCRTLGIWNGKYRIQENAQETFRPIQSSDLKFLLKMPFLEELQLCIKGFDHLGLPSEDELYLRTEDIRYFRNLKNLRRLYVHHLDADALPKLVKLLPKLEVLMVKRLHYDKAYEEDYDNYYFDHYDISKTFKALAKHPNLKELYLGRIPFLTLEDIRPFAKRSYAGDMQSLSVLKLFGERVPMDPVEQRKAACILDHCDFMAFTYSCTFQKSINH